MTNNIYPPDHLLRKWESLIIDEEQNVDVVLYEAFQAGADQELEACCEWLVRNYNYPEAANPLRLARRPKPPSLKDKALKALRAIETGTDRLGDSENIRLALESLPNEQ